MRIDREEFTFVRDEVRTDIERIISDAIIKAQNEIFDKHKVRPTVDVDWDIGKKVENKRYVRIDLLPEENGYGIALSSIGVCPVGAIDIVSCAYHLNKGGDIKTVLEKELCPSCRAGIDNCGGKECIKESDINVVKRK